MRKHTLTALLLPVLLLYLSGCQKENYQQGPAYTLPLPPVYSYALSMESDTTIDTFANNQVSLQLATIPNPDYKSSVVTSYYNNYSGPNPYAVPHDLYKITLTAADSNSKKTFTIQFTLPFLVTGEYSIDGANHSYPDLHYSGSYIGNASYKDSTGLYGADLMINFLKLDPLGIGGGFQGWMTNISTQGKVRINGTFYKLG